MVKKIFVLASVTALTGLIASVGAAGCSSTVTAVNDTPETGSSSGMDSSRPPTDGSVDMEDSAVPPSVCPSTDPITAADIEMAFKWVPPVKPPQAACVQKNLDDLKAVFVKGGGSAMFTDIVASLGATCGACAATAKTAANWGPIVTDGSGGLDNSLGACLAFADPGGDACGKAFFEFDQCLNAACGDASCPTDAASVKACNTAAAKGACKTLNATVGTACTGIQDATSLDNTACGGIVDSIAIACGGGFEGGLDSSVQ